MIGMAHQTVCWGLTNCVCVRGEYDWVGLSNCVLVSYKLRVCEGEE